MSASLFIFFTLIVLVTSAILYLLILSSNTNSRRKQLQISKKDIYEQANLLFKQKRYKLVEKLARKYLETNPEHIKLRTLLVKASYNNDNIYDAMRDALIVLNQNPNDKDTRLILARCYKKINQYSKAITEFKELLNQDEENMIVLRELSEIYIETNQKALAIETLEKLANALNVDMKEFLDRLLDYYHLTHDDYLTLTAPVSIENFAYGHKFDKIDEAVKFIYSFVKESLLTLSFFGLIKFILINFEIISVIENFSEMALISEDELHNFCNS